MAAVEPFGNAPDPYSGLSDADLMALLGGGATADYVNSNLPYGFTFNKATGITYRQDETGKLVPATPQEVQQAVLAESQMGSTGGGGSAAAPPRPESMIDPRTGELVLIDPYSGAVTRTGNQLGFAGIDPREQFAAEQQQQGFGNELQRRAQAINLMEIAQNNVLRAAQMAEQGKMDRAGLTESARATDLRAAVDQWQTAMNLIPQLGQLSIQESSRVQDLLQNGGDFLARAFESRGGTSPLAKITQADQINALGNTLNGLRNMVQQNTAAGPASSTGAKLPGYEAPVLPEGNIPDLPGFTPYQLSAPQAVSTPAPAAAATGEGGLGGSIGTAAEPAPQLNYKPPAYPTGAPAAAPEEFPTPRGYQDYGSPEPVKSAPLPWAYGQNPTPSAGSTPVNPYGFAYTQDQVGGVPTTRSSGNSLTSLLGRLAGYRGNTSQVSVPNSRIAGYAEGNGMTNDRMFVGNEQGPELYINPTGAPIAVVPADQTERMVDGKRDGTFELNGYEEGTEAGGMWSNRERNRFLTNRSLNDLQSNPEAMQMAMGSVGPAGGGKGFANAAKSFDRDMISLRQAQMAVGNAGGKVTPELEQLLWTLQQKTGIRGFATGTGMYPPAAPPSPYKPGGGVDQGLIDEYNAYQSGDRYGAPVNNIRPQVTQKELIELGQRNAPPAVSSVLAGGVAPAQTALESMAVPGKFLKGITARQFQGMTPEEIQALGTMTNTEYNAPLDFVVGRTNALFGQPQQRRGFLGGRGL